MRAKAPVKPIPEETLKQWEEHGVTLEEPDDHILVLRHNGEVKCRFSQTGVDPDEIIKEAENIINGG